MKRDIAEAEITRARIRALQAIYPQEHAALLNWARWSRDRHGIYPAGVVGGEQMWEEGALYGQKEVMFKRLEAEEAREAIADGREARAERAEREEYDERAGEDLDQRIHNSHDFSAYQRDILRVAYVSRETPEDQFPRHAGCTEDAFCERLEGCLRFVSRHC